MGAPPVMSDLSDSIFSSSAPSSGDEDDASDRSDASSIFDGPVPAVPSFEADEIGTWLNDASPEERDAAPYGIIEVDAGGNVVFYNETEADFAGVDPETAEGKHFFTELAPCSNNGRFHGRFRAHARDDSFDETFAYTFTYRIHPTRVDIRMLRRDGRTWILVRPEFTMPTWE